MAHRDDGAAAAVPAARVQRGGVQGHVLGSEGAGCAEGGAGWAGVSKPCSTRFTTRIPLCCRAPLPQFLRCWPLFGFSPHEVPQLEDLSAVLQRSTGFQIRPVAGLVRVGGLCGRLGLRRADQLCSPLARLLARPLTVPPATWPTLAAPPPRLPQRPGLPHLPLDPGKGAGWWGTMVWGDRLSGVSAGTSCMRRSWQGA